MAAPIGAADRNRRPRAAPPPPPARPSSGSPAPEYGRSRLPAHPHARTPARKPASGTVPRAAPSRPGGRRPPMYVADPSLPLPSDEQPIWRYLDFAKFVAMLDTGEFYLARADTFVDPFELAIPRLDVVAAREAAMALITSGPAARSGVLAYLAHHGDRPIEELQKLPDERLARELLRLSNRALYVNCWHMNDDESAAMWTVYVGAVTYLDYARQSWGPYRPFNAVMHKRRSFAHEQELRAVVVRPTWAELADYGEHPDRLPDSTGVGIPVNLDRLIRRVLVSPRAPEWYVTLVASMLHRFGCERTPVQSDLYTSPSF